MPPRLAAREILVRYSPASSPVLAQFSLALEAGSFLGIIGPNGSGKSTLIRAISRALKPQGGAVFLDDHDLYTGYSARASAKSIGVVSQDTSVSLDFSVREIVRMGRAPHLPRRPFAAETAADERVVREALRAGQVEDLADRLVSTLSGGERQRVLFARALAQEPDILLLDEPTASLDLHHQVETLSLAQNLAHFAGKAVLAVLHDVNLAAAYCDRLILLDQGAIAASGTPAEVLTAENLLAVYGARVWVRPNPASGRPLVLSLPELPRKSENENKNENENGGEKVRPEVHVICGGGTGTGLLVALHHLGYLVTVAGLNAGDTDAEAAQMLGLPFALEAAFSLLSYSVLEQAAAFARSADVVLVTEVPFGRTNLASLQAALTLCRTGKPVLCLQNPLSDFAARDFTGGAAQKAWAALLEAGALVLPDQSAVLAHLESCNYGSNR